MELLSSNIKKTRKWKPRKKIPYISGNGALKKLLIFREMEPFSPSPKKI